MFPELKGFSEYLALEISRFWSRILRSMGFSRLRPLLPDHPLALLIAGSTAVPRRTK
jgi:hypothetical protein